MNSTRYCYRVLFFLAKVNDHMREVFVYFLATVVAILTKMEL